MDTSPIHLTRADIEEVLHYAHWIAAKNGTQAKFVNSKYPHHTFRSLIEAISDTGCLVKSRTRGNKLAHFSGLKVRSEINFVEIPRSGPKRIDHK